MRFIEVLHSAPCLCVRLAAGCLPFLARVWTPLTASLPPAWPPPYIHSGYFVRAPVNGENAPYPYVTSFKVRPARPDRRTAAVGTEAVKG